jgi:hypothetical protein
MKASLSRRIAVLEPVLSTVLFPRFAFEIARAQNESASVARLT